MNYTPTRIAEVLGVSPPLNFQNNSIKEVSIDSRTILNPNYTLFFALEGKMKDGHKFIQHAFEKGVRNYVVSTSGLESQFPNANFYKVDNTLDALQKLASYHRSEFKNLTKIAITGSNGKTIIKEWLYQMLYDVFNIVKSPKSYNSQIGMALSIMGIEKAHELGIFEAGISEKDEMKNHFTMLQPTIGLITNIGAAHDKGFESRAEKLAEKMLLFSNVGSLVYCKDHTQIEQYIQVKLSHIKSLNWGFSDGSDIQILDNEIDGTNRKVRIRYRNENYELLLRFSDSASFENCMHCVAIMCVLEIPFAEICKRVHRISGLHMRLEMTTGIQQSIIVNDAYSADLDSLQIALDFVQQQAGSRSKMAILSEFDQSGLGSTIVFQKTLDHLVHHGFDELIYLSNRDYPVQNESINVRFYGSKQALLDRISTLNIAHKIILIKGARRFGLEDISERLTEKSHSATLQINLNALEHNLRVYNNHLKEDTGIIAVIKASAYGSGAAEIGHVLQRNNIDYLAVAFVDEGVELRKAGIASDIMVLNPDLSSLPDILRYNLEPEVYDFNQLLNIIEFAKTNEVTLNIHLKLDSGMHRLGFLESQIESLAEALSNNKNVYVKSIFSHLASSEDASDDTYTEMQFSAFDRMCELLTASLTYQPQKHILNSGGISRFYDRQYDLVRLGIGMYGIDKNPGIKALLRKVHSLYASVIQIKKLKKGDSVGYNRKTILQRDTVVGIINIGYADGLIRNLGNGKYSFLIDENKVQILGNVCMDLTMVDLTDLDEVYVGQEVVIFNEYHPIEKLAHHAGTIPYEILSRISSRVKRKFVRE